MKIYRTILVLVLFISVSPFSQGNEIESFYKSGVHFFKASRYYSAEIRLNQLVESLRKSNQTNQPIYYHAIEFLALSRSEQGKIIGVSSLISERLEIGKKQFGIKSYDTGNNMMTLAEAYYREGKKKQALEMLGKAESIYKNLSPKYHDRLSFLEQNREEYLQGSFDSSKLPFDLSNFYLACESIPLNNEYASTKIKMQSYVEVGVDYKPKGMWADIFSNSKLTGVGAIPEHDKRIIYIPKEIDSLKDEWCVVFTKSGITVAAFAHEG